MMLAVSKSSTEFEYHPMASFVSLMLWIQWLLQELNTSQIGLTPLYCDNQAVHHITNNHVIIHTQKTHVSISTTEHVADIFTKSLGAKQFLHLLGELGVRDLHIST
uniref:Uncharacterized protein n=1 Tax=Lactuca sativa TaxID=4236 RepID=A0A9R1XBL4_LACSA|nr:hypothetical protein LSAT_V11C500286720 [Lactuca sativa]